MFITEYKLSISASQPLSTQLRSVFASDHADNCLIWTLHNMTCGWLVQGPGRKIKNQSMFRDSQNFTPWSYFNPKQCKLHQIVSLASPSPSQPVIHFKLLPQVQVHKLVCSCHLSSLGLVIWHTYCPENKTTDVFCFSSFFPTMTDQCR